MAIKGLGKYIYPERGLISRIYKELQIDQKNTDNPPQFLRGWGEGEVLNRHFTN